MVSGEYRHTSAKSFSTKEKDPEIYMLGMTPGTANTVEPCQGKQQQS
jgi:hypothetical protein